MRSPVNAAVARNSSGYARLARAKPLGSDSGRFFRRLIRVDAVRP
jgi:hypothetical protein